MFKKKALFLSTILFVFAPFIFATSIIGVSVPVNSQDAASTTRDSGVFSVSAPPFPLDINTGVGVLINPTAPLSSFVLHDHVYISPHIVDPTRAVITYEFDSAAVVDQVHIVQHTNGISQIEGFVGNSLSNLTSVGAVFGPDGDITGSGIFSERETQVFDFNNNSAGKFFQIVIRKTSLSNGWATYRMFLGDSSGQRFEAALEESTVPEPSSWILFGFGLLLWRKSIKK